jgi:hypothetical protein
MAVELMATILAVGVLIKLVFVLIKPDGYFGFAKSLYSNPMLIRIVFVVLAAITGYYLLQTVSIVTIAAVALFIMLIAGIGIVPYIDEIFSAMESRPKTAQAILSRHWLSFLIWLGIAIWVLITLYA